MNPQNSTNSTDDDYEMEDEDDLITLQIKIKKIQLKFSQLDKYSKLIRHQYLISDVTNLLSHELQVFVEENHIDEENLFYFFKIFKDEKITITNSKYSDLYKLSEFLQVTSLLRRLDKYRKKHINDIDFIISIILSENSIQNDTESKLSIQMEQILIYKIDECIKNENFKKLPVSLILQIFEKSDKKIITSDLIFDFIKESMDSFYVLLSFLDVQNLSKEKFEEFLEMFLNSKNDRMKHYIQYLHFDLKYIEKLKESVELIKQYENELKKVSEENQCLKDKIKKLEEKNEVLKCQNEQDIQHLKNQINKVEEENKNLRVQLNKNEQNNHYLKDKKNKAEENEEESSKSMRPPSRSSSSRPKLDDSIVKSLLSQKDHIVFLLEGHPKSKNSCSQVVSEFKKFKENIQRYINNPLLDSYCKNFINVSSIIPYGKDRARTLITCLNLISNHIHT